MPYGTLYAPKKTYMGSTQQPYSPWGLAFKNTHPRTIDRESHRAIENNPRGREDKRLSATVSLGWRRLKQTKKSPKKKRKKQSTTPPLYTTVSCTPLASLSLSSHKIQQDRRGVTAMHGVKAPPALSPSTTSNLPQNLHLHRQIREGVQTLEGPWLPPRGSAAQPSRRGEPPPRACVFPEPAAAFAQPR